MSMVPRHESSRVANITKLTEIGLAPNYGLDIQAQFDRHYKDKLEQQASEATKVVHLEKKMHGPPTVMEEFAQLEKLYLGTSNGVDALQHTEEDHQQQSRIDTELTRAQMKEHIAHTAFDHVHPVDTDERAEEKIATEILFVQKAYLSQSRDQRLRIATKVAADAERWRRRAQGKDEDFDDDDDDDGNGDGDGSENEGRREASLEIRARMRMDLVRADLTADQFAHMLVAEGMPRARADEMARLTKDIKPKLSYQKGPDGVFTKFKGTGILPPNHRELAIIQSVLTEARADKSGVAADRSRMPDPNKTHELEWYNSKRQPLSVSFADDAPDEANSDDDMTPAVKMTSNETELKAPVGRVSEKYKLKKKVPFEKQDKEAQAASGPTICAFCGKRPGAGDNWILQRYIDDTVDPHFLTYAHFCDDHAFERLLLRRPTTGVQLKSVVWNDLRKVAIHDRETLRNWRWCGRFWLTLFSIANISALIIAVVAIVVSVLDSRCASLGSTSAQTFTFDRSSLQNLRIETTRGIVKTRPVAAGAPVQVVVSVAADRPHTLASIAVHSTWDNETATADVTVRHDSNEYGQLRRGSVIHLTSCYSVSIEVDLPVDAQLFSYSIDQRWSIDNCTVHRSHWPFSMVPHQILSECLIGGLVPADPKVSISVDLDGLNITDVALGTNRGAVVIEKSAAVQNSLRVLAARGFESSGHLRFKLLAVATLGGDIAAESIEFDGTRSHDGGGGSPADSDLSTATFTRGAGWESTLKDVSTSRITNLDRDGTVTIGHIEGLGSLQIIGGTERTDVHMSLTEFQPWHASLQTCGGRMKTTTQRLEPAPLMRSLPLICQRLFDNRIELCEPFAAAARAAGRIDVAASYAGNGFCEEFLNVDPCYDGGDCCESTCDRAAYPQRCGVALNATLRLDTLSDRVWNCTDKWARENYGPLPDCGQILLDNDAYWSEQLKVWSRTLTPMAITAGSPWNAEMLDTGQPGETPWGWYACETALGPLFGDRPRIDDTGVDLSHDNPSANYARGWLDIALQEGDIIFELAEAVPFSEVWERHETGLIPGWSCNIWACTDIDECASDPCGHGGICKDSRGIDKAQLSPVQLFQLELHELRQTLHAHDVSSNHSNHTNRTNQSNGTINSALMEELEALLLSLSNQSNASNSSNFTTPPGNINISGIGNMPIVALGHFNCSCPPTFAGDRCEIAKEYALYRLRVTSTAAEVQVCIGEMWFYGLDGRRFPQIAIGSTGLLDIDRVDSNSINIDIRTVLNVTTNRTETVTYVFSPTRLFDGSTSSKYCSWDGEDITEGAPVDVIIELPSPLELTRYAVQAAGASLAPTSYVLEAFDGNQWQTLDTRSHLSWNRETEVKWFDIDVA